MVNFVLVVPFKKSTNYWHEPLHAQNGETNGSIELLQLCPVVAPDVLLEMMAIISAILSLSEHLVQTNTFCISRFYQLMCLCLIWYFLFRIGFAKRFVESSKWFWHKVMFESEHMFFSLMHCVCTCTASVQLNLYLFSHVPFFGSHMPVYINFWYSTSLSFCYSSYSHIHCHVEQHGG